MYGVRTLLYAIQLKRYGLEKGRMIEFCVAQTVTWLMAGTLLTDPLANNHSASM